MRASPPSQPFPADFFRSFDPRGPLEAAILFKRNGGVLAAWVKDGAPVDVVTVMAATLLGSVETLLEALGHSGLSRLSMVAGAQRLLITKIEARAALLLVAPSFADERWLQRVADHVASRVPPPGPKLPAVRPRIRE